MGVWECQNPFQVPKLAAKMQPLSNTDIRLDDAAIPLLSNLFYSDMV